LPRAGRRPKHEKAARHGDVLLELDRLIRAEMEEYRGQDAEPAERDSRPPRLEPDKDEESPAELGQDHQRQQSLSDAVLRHIGADIAIIRDLFVAFDDEDVGEHGAGEQKQRAGVSSEKRELPVEARTSRPIDRRARWFSRRHCEAP
jgi:hypothetical protein